MVSPFDLTGRVVMVTGASSGIGRETSIILSRLGARLILVARNQDRLAETHNALQVASHAVEAYDLSAFQHIPDWMREVASRHGKIDGVVHCAGVHIFSPLKMMQAEGIETLWHTNI